VNFAAEHEPTTGRADSDDVSECRAGFAGSPKAFDGPWLAHFSRPGSATDATPLAETPLPLAQTSLEGRFPGKPGVPPAAVVRNVYSL
jgi:hypothetical protein